jgi:hypothetical protein
MSAKSTLVAFVVLLAAVSSQGAASAQDYFGPAGKKSEPKQTVNRVKSKLPFNARASREASPSRRDYHPALGIGMEPRRTIEKVVSVRGRNAGLMPRPLCQDSGYASTGCRQRRAP